MPDKYDKHIAYLQKHPEDIEDDFVDGKGIFKFFSKEGKFESTCPAFVFDFRESAPTPAMTKAIRADKHMAATLSSDMPLATLRAYAKYQRWADRVLGKNR